MAQTSQTRHIDPAVLMQIRSLELRVRAVMQGSVTGLHRSPFHGFSVEFSEYRQYSEGDDLRYLDWKIVARSDRYYIKRFEDETNLRCHIVVDNSRSMTFGSTPRAKSSETYSKADYAKTLAACLAYCLIQQRDAAGLVMFDERVDEFVPARFRHGQLRQICVALERAPSGQATDLVGPLDRVAAQVRKRGLVVLISDLLAPIEGLERALTALQACGHELVVFHVLDPQELSLNFETAALFVDAETDRELYIDPRQAQEKYQARITAHCQSIRRTCDKLGALYEQVSTSQSLEYVLSEFLALTSRMKSRGQRRQSAGTR